MNISIDLSIIVPIYKVENCIARCAQSLFEQTHPSIEFIFVNDCSPDKSIEVLKTVIDNYPHLKEQIKIIQHKQNKGVAITRNTGLENAQGRYVIQVDSDDWVERTMAEEMLKLAAETNADIVWTDFIIDYPNDEKNSIYRKQCFSTSSEACIHAILVGEMHGASWNKMIKRELLLSNNILFPPGIIICEDMVFVIYCLLKASTISYLPKAFYHYIQNESSITMVTNKKAFESQFAVINLLEKNLPMDNYRLSLIIYKARLKSAVFFSGLFSSKEFSNCYPESNAYLVKSTSGRLNKMIIWLAVRKCFRSATVIKRTIRLIY